MPKAPGVGFFVGDTPYACWEWNMSEKNLEFIRGIEDSYFEYVASVHKDNLEGDRRHLAALSIRTAYFHGIETLLTLICAATFAPHCVPGWIQRCSTPELREIIERINKGSCVTPNRLGVERVRWDAIAERVLPFYDLPKEERSRIHSEFAGVWRRLAADWLQASNVGEYNSIKHGLRVQPGGFSIAFAPTKEDGSEPSPEEMTPLGGSKFGSSYFHAEPVRNAPDNSRTHFRIRRHHTNWNPESLCHALALISGSICNVKSFLHHWNGDKAADLMIFRPVDTEEFWVPWKNTPTVSSAWMDSDVREEHIERISKDEIAKKLRERFEKDIRPPQGS